MRRTATIARRTSLALLGILSLAILAVGQEKKSPATTLAEEQIQYGPARELCKLSDQQIKESSGIACSRVNRGVFWTHNDSGDSARIYAFNLKGESLGTFTLAGVQARDWEDIASYQRGKAGLLLIGDIGDNKADRPDYAIHFVAEPQLPVRSNFAPAAILPLATIRFQYADGPHNCESLAIDPTDEVIYLVSKTGDPQCQVYSLPLPKAKTAQVLVAKPIATLKIPTTTAMDISPDGRRAVVLTYGDAYEYLRGPNEKWADAFVRAPRCLPMPQRAQGESICYGPNGRQLYLTSEKLPCPLLEVPAGGQPASTEEPNQPGDAIPFRTWMDSTGKHTVEAKFVRYDSSKVYLVSKDGKEISFPMIHLSKSDQEWVRAELKRRYMEKTQKARPGR